MDAELHAYSCDAIIDVVTTPEMVTNANTSILPLTLQLVRHLRDVSLASKNTQRVGLETAIEHRKKFSQLLVDIFNKLLQQNTHLGLSDVVKIPSESENNVSYKVLGLLVELYTQVDTALDYTYQTLLEINQTDTDLASCQFTLEELSSWISSTLQTIDVTQHQLKSATQESGRLISDANDKIVVGIQESQNADIGHHWLVTQAHELSLLRKTMLNLHKIIVHCELQTKRLTNTPEINTLQLQLKDYKAKINHFSALEFQLQNDLAVNLRLASRCHPGAIAGSDEQIDLIRSTLANASDEKEFYVSLNCYTQDMLDMLYDQNLTTLEHSGQKSLMIKRCMVSQLTSGLTGANYYFLK
ncbi:MAG: hypothetical protein HWE26_17620 [Alteromonadaceae bacterium]|nr:hypothetical protein [Alteromonadaceae bacterium]